MDKENLRENMLEALGNRAFVHGTAVAKVIYENPEDQSKIVDIGDKGLITAYLPEDETFAAFFENGLWHTFYETEELFNKHFDVSLVEFQAE